MIFLFFNVLNILNFKIIEMKKIIENFELENQKWTHQKLKFES